MTNNSIQKSVTTKTLILCLCVVILFVQMFKLHLHVVHDNTSTTHGHLVDIHTESSSHAASHDTIYQNNIESDHPAELDISPTAVTSKIDLSKLFLSFIIVLIIAFQVFRTPNTFSTYSRKFRFNSLYYLLNPPLRAPPQ